MNSSKTKDGLEGDADTASPKGFIEAIQTLYEAFLNRFGKRPTEVGVPANAMMMNEVIDYVADNDLRFSRHATPYKRVQVLAADNSQNDKETVDMKIDNSEHLQEVSWAEGVLTVTFQRGGVYNYYDVPEVMYEALVHLDAIELSGKLFRQCIKDNYEYKKVTASKAAPEPKEFKAPVVKPIPDKTLPNGLAQGDVITGINGVYVLVKDPENLDGWRHAYDVALEEFQKMGLDLDKAALSVPPSEATDQLIEELGLEESDLIKDSYTTDRLYVGIPSAMNDRVSA